MHTFNDATHRLYIDSETGRIEVSFTDTYGGMLALRAERAPACAEHPHHQTWTVTDTTATGHFVDQEDYSKDALGAALMTHALIDRRLGETTVDTSRSCAFPKTGIDDPQYVTVVRNPDDRDVFTLIWNHPDTFYEYPVERRDEIARRISVIYRDYCQPKPKVATISSHEPVFPARVSAGTLTRKLSKDRKSMAVTQCDNFGGSLSVVITLQEDNAKNLIGVMTDFAVSGHYDTSSPRQRERFLMDILKSVTGFSCDFIPPNRKVDYVFSDRRAVDFSFTAQRTSDDDTAMIEYMGICCDGFGNGTVAKKLLSEDLAACYSTYMAPKPVTMFVEEKVL